MPMPGIPHNILSRQPVAGWLIALLALPASPLCLAAGQQQLAEVTLEVHVTREAGVGDCGMPPWGVDHINGGDFSCPGSKYWFGYQLAAVMSHKLLLVGDTENRWSMTSTEPGIGTYRQTDAYSDGNRICAPTEITTPHSFTLNTEGEVKNRHITMEFSTFVEESTRWSCQGGHGYDRKTTLLLIDWTRALSSESDRAIVSLTPQERVKPGVYRKQIATRMNPSPQDRDFVTVDLQFTCYQPRARGDTQDLTVACPWE